MAAVGMVFNARSEFEEQPPQDPHEVRYLAGFQDLDAFGLQWRRQAAQVGWDEAEQQLALTDGAPCLEEFIRKNAPRATPILDFYHASEHVAELVRSLYPETFEQQQAEWCHTLKHAGGGALLAIWQALDQTGWSDAQRECYRQQEQYVRNNVHRMDYPTYRARGWMIGSGPVEAACKLVVGQRLKGDRHALATLRQRQPLPPPRPLPQPARPMGILLVWNRRLNSPTNKTLMPPIGRPSRSTINPRRIPR